jgi:formylglycine-generating enzyme required for sulfatase activity
MSFVRIPAGEFEMGALPAPPPLVAPAVPKQPALDETRHHVKIAHPFMMAVAPVTQFQWATLTGRNPSHFRGEQLPVETVSHGDALAFAEALSKKEGNHHYRLPTEAEWEYACRAGTKSDYIFGDGPLMLIDYGWYQGNSLAKTHEVATKKPNSWGLYDMHGNVQQWCLDFYAPYEIEAVDPMVARTPNRTQCVFRGGAFDEVASECRSNARKCTEERFAGASVGLRLVLDYDDVPHGGTN